MSYILNALKKAENKSFEGENLKVKKQILILKRQTRGGKLKILLLVSGLLGTLLLGGWLGYMQTGKTAKPEVATRAQPTTNNDLMTTTEKRPATVTTALTHAPQRHENVRPEPMQQNHINDSDSVVRNTDIVNPPIPVRAVPMPNQARPEEVTQPVTVEEPAIETETSTQSYADIPLKIKQQLPSLKISLHFYNSIPEKRLVRINGRNLHEGDRVEAGLTVEEIKPTATVLNYDGYLFELNAPGGS
ncbi:Type II secretion system protein B [Desulfuromusa kysingii]|uniref:Type II secretion system protein B n=1 Tax=Desulfuromusa kysingii TaxID=37625 RepID=A0A1H4CRB8_9BACT|nr:general secretion pathway protein GspB [Desulfuromusa kysingii]SEA62848.1 Type II secretion system protein B [Desulfuromusa kysingii]